MCDSQSFPLGSGQHSFVRSHHRMREVRSMPNIRQQDGLLMSTSSTGPRFTFIAQPSGSRSESWSAIPCGEDLVKVATSNAPVHKRIGALRHFWNLTGESSQAEQWDALAATASIDIAAARMLEPHLDALGILAEAGADAPPHDSTWGVYAAESPGKALTADTQADGSATLSGTKAWCSLAADLSHAIVTAFDGREPRAYAVSLSDSRVHPSDEAWPSVGLSEIPSGSVGFDHAPATAVGAPGWYLQRPSFAWGGIRVAACWFGGAMGIARKATQYHFARPYPSPLGNLVLGQIDAEIFAARSTLSHAATLINSDVIESRDEAWKLALRVRNIVYRSAQRIQLLARELAGPAALTGDRSFAKADADLTVYLSQHHGPRDEAALGEEIADCRAMG